MNTDSPYLNRAAVKKLALQLSRKTRNGKFTRVGSTFFERLNRAVATMVASELKAEAPPLYINRTAVKKLAEKVADNEGLDVTINGVLLDRINRKFVEVVSSEVHRHRSVGKTLQ